MTEYKKGILEEDEREFFERMNEGYKCTGETLNEKLTDSRGFESSTTFVVFKGRSTRYGMCRDAGDHYIIARWSRYDRIDKKTLEITHDVADR